MRKLFDLIVKSRFIKVQKFLANNESRAINDQQSKRGWVNSLFGKYLLLTNTVSSGVLMFFGDIASQEIEKYQHKSTTLPKKQKTNRYDWERLGIMTIVGISQGPLHHYLYKWLDVFYPGVDVKTVFKKIMADQIVISPIFIVTYFYSTGYLERQPMSDINNEFRNKCLTIYTADWFVWPPTQFLNFYFIAPQYRVLYINAITMLYNVFLCYIKHQKLDDDASKRKTF